MNSSKALKKTNWLFFTKMKRKRVARAVSQNLLIVTPGSNGKVEPHEQNVLSSKEIGMATGRRKRWSKHVTEKSNALDLEEGVFSKDDPRSIARSLKRSADRSRRRKSDPFRSAMSMLTFYINRAGKQLSKSRVKRLEVAKEELRDLYGRSHKM